MHRLAGSLHLLAPRVHALHALHASVARGRTAGVLRACVPPPACDKTRCRGSPESQNCSHAFVWPWRCCPSPGAAMYELVRIGNFELIGEIIRLEGACASAASRGVLRLGERTFACGES
jgi:hypothetical protein